MEENPHFIDNTHFLEADWHHFLRTIRYKAHWYNKKLIFVEDVKKFDEFVMN
ncbi:hypothetical protein [Tetragenococcus muriaticus]|uniref:Uncharacterized protein n=1 Tax=Tetragenococcus muriaticus 3MR10-3 TaxID=1302648 RepID=A0A091BVZ1_9ENTE|nr:hypothetical protein [Tetragenococcus muriaticus]KFN89811.1 hypothetical protein TMU3MR103_1793 [Tetragenococcus muriaticus 3MR10-3]